ncbi:DUF2892 domain-containing protein [Faucicola mancuniensis]|uniref:YgaP family membrane protein n=1 Tax=Faucicola mancuniensis TaxID=1309795 RepID=UPI0028E7DF5E|nr:DUF2892 domain-containing protein [uncultured Moraxella sp.]
MKHNVGSIDKTMRIVVGLAIIGAGFYFGSWWGAVGLVPLLTGLTGFCALYSLFGINTCRIKS